MTLKIFLFFQLIILQSVLLLGQNYPTSYLLQDEQKLSKLADENPSSNSISDIIAIGDTVWLGTSRGVSLSTDRGENWTNFYGTEAFGDVSISSMAYNKYDGSLWVATAKSVDVSGSLLPSGQGLKYTRDLGQTWTSIPQPVDGPGDSLLVYGINDGVNLPKVRALPVTVTIQNLTYDIAFTHNAIWISSFAGALRKSTDRGQTWERVLLPADSLNSLAPTDTVRFALQAVAGAFGKDDHLNHRVFSVISTDSATVYVGTAGGINKSTDNGINWKKFTRLNQDNAISGNFVVALGYDTSSSTVWGATWRAEGETEFYGVSSTSNGGDDWLTYLEGERPHNFGFVNGTDIITATDNGALRSPDGGNSWILPGPIVDANTKLSLNTTLFYSASSEGNSIWLGTADGLAKLEETSGIWNGNWKLFFASQKLSSSTETYAYPNPFSPRLEQLKIKYSTGGKRETVSIRVFDFGMNYVSTIIQNVERGNNVHVVDGKQNADEGVIDFWDGKDASGNFVPNGVYFYRIEVGSGDPVYGKILVLQ